MMRKRVYSSQPTKPNQAKKARTYRAAPKNVTLSKNNNVFAILPYHESSYGNISVAANTQLSWVFGGNSLFDPDKSIGGHQPLTFDQMMGLYHHFFVQSSSINLKIGMASTQIGVQVYVWADTASSAPAYADVSLTAELCRLRGGKTTMVQSSLAQNIYVSAKTAKLLGPRDDDQEGTVLADPTKQWYWHVVIHNAAAAGTSIQCMPLLSYVTEFSDRFTSVQS